MVSSTKVKTVTADSPTAMPQIHAAMASPASTPCQTLTVPQAKTAATKKRANCTRQKKNLSVVLVLIVQLPKYATLVFLIVHLMNSHPCCQNAIVGPDTVTLRIASQTIQIANCTLVQKKSVH
jgi:hypothetical protein